MKKNMDGNRYNTNLAFAPPKYPKTGAYTQVKIFMNAFQEFYQFVSVHGSQSHSLTSHHVFYELASVHAGPGGSY